MPSWHWRCWCLCKFFIWNLKKENEWKNWRRKYYLLISFSFKDNFQLLFFSQKYSQLIFNRNERTSFSALSWFAETVSFYCQDWRLWWNHKPNSRTYCRRWNRCIYICPLNFVITSFSTKGVRLLSLISISSVNQIQSNILIETVTTILLRSSQSFVRSCCWDVIRRVAERRSLRDEEMIDLIGLISEEMGYLKYIYIY